MPTLPTSCVTHGLGKLEGEGLGLGDGVGVGVTPERGLSAGPVPVGVKEALVVKSRRSKRKPSSLIHTLMVCTPAVATLICATGPSSVLLNHVHAPYVLVDMRSELETLRPSRPTWTELLLSLSARARRSEERR